MGPPTRPTVRDRLKAAGQVALSLGSLACLLVSLAIFDSVRFWDASPLAQFLAGCTCAGLCVLTYISIYNTAR